ncbi:MAG: Sec-independent protein translocase protein TatB [Alphaproteobacteria bacterium MarineAlpha5_Bin11]|nr:hypothetical protein [Pelagibacteraceae bacterium]PPR42579.1 MAG: Sec-independent protein translocase protein TatB [Alphaproteobacteria bacterium MarineAlpha5_Bin11]|tara:strand:- start:21010 stop:21336 length:327 start_codon:yes stop_codon:yes gene_type:complete
MLSLGWPEVFIVLLVVIIVIGPKELPSLIKHLGSFTKKIRSISREFNTSMNNIVKDSEIDKINFNKISSEKIKEKIIEKSELKEEFKEVNSSFEKLNDKIDIEDNKKK